MADLEQQSESAEPSPLNRDEMIALSGAVAVVVGTFLPAIHTGFGEANFRNFANTATVILWGFAAAVAWSVARRRTHEVTGSGVLILLILLAFCICVLLENMLEPVATFIGSLKVEFRPMAWGMIGTGSAAIQYAGIRSARNHISHRSSPHMKGFVLGSDQLNLAASGGRSGQTRYLLEGGFNAMGNLAVYNIMIGFIVIPIASLLGAGLAIGIIRWQFLKSP